ncbi:MULTISPECIES: FCD domain-containing protein [Streptomyces]|uniref:FCD domain-containing protein n=1 Tax=Streptomyces TaxID=1883 RepID=UPI00163C146B|nr:MULTISPECIES: FCD domain-containing protein [Streptomyces]MBC2879669.1 FCD domain-containing protein [Streptomyces sp. TYQ1024]UBI35082.1 FCD domain-containing protein [Streptomyces mobaraensis]UKW27675.1 FCD domain-containing protein [Streptomyces sp. TYQ1024]
MGTTDHRTDGQGGHAERHARDGADLPALCRADWERASAPSRAETAADRVADRVARSRPGARLGTKEELRAECGVSVGTFNEALRLLQTRGLVTVRPGPGGGLFAAQPPPAGPRRDAWTEALDGQRPDEAVRVRDALDPLLVSDALWHASPADVAGLRRLLAPLAEAAGAADPAAFAQADRRLRSSLAALAPGALLRSLYEGLLPLAERADAAADSGSLRARLDRRTALVDALDARDRALALRLAGGGDGEGRDGEG